MSRVFPTICMNMCRCPQFLSIAPNRAPASRRDRVTDFACDSSQIALSHMQFDPLGFHSGRFPRDIAHEGKWDASLLSRFFNRPRINNLKAKTPFEHNPQVDKRERLHTQVVVAWLRASQCARPAVGDGAGRQCRNTFTVLPDWLAAAGILQPASTRTRGRDEVRGRAGANGRQAVAFSLSSGTVSGREDVMLVATTGSRETGIRGC